MKSRRQVSKRKKINPHFWVFCEGETEEAYIRFLRSEYRLPLEIIPKIAGCDISSRYIISYKKGKPTHKKDKDFLVYDADVPEVLDKLKKIASTILVASNPAIEIWFLLHFKNQTAYITADECIRQLKNRNKNYYKKGILNVSLVSKLKERRAEACKRSKELDLYNNPSTNMHIFIEELEKVKNEQQNL
ncbi:MAG: RloB family protein [Bacteroidales bacterium]|nr:RloB family protein [Bacteroidales bacterium]MCF8458566.1 RloB family protein [Bacteroidales bacterium]